MKIYIINNKLFACVAVIFIFMMGYTPLALNGQNPNTILAHNDLIISVNNIAIHGEIRLRGLDANFPYPILSTISVVDSLGDIVPGLADTLRWLDPTDIAENGLPITQIWEPILEYHEENRLFPPNPNLYDQKPLPLITEVRWTEPLPTSTMLVMDVSTSMTEEIDDAKEGACLYINLMRPVDRGGVVEFSSTVAVYQEMTGDTALLKQTINDADLSAGTAIYDALIAAIDGIKSEVGRRGIIVYTDGQDNNSSFTPEAVIDSARTYNLPIYTIALGNETQENILKQIADSTSGIFFKAATAEEMKIIYGKLSVLMQNYYVMAHASPDPFFNKTWRLVDITVNLPGWDGQGIGRYFVGGPPPSLNTDLAVDLESITDTTIAVAGDSFNAVYPGDNFQYLIKMKNFGPNLADTVKLVHMLPDSVQFINASLPPEFVAFDSLGWTLSGIVPQGEVNISVNVKLAANVSRTLTDLVSEAKISAQNDTLAANNVSIDTIKVLFPEIPRNYDLSLSQTAITDTIIELAGDSVQAVLLGDDYAYSLKIKNTGPATAYDFTLWDVFPDSVTLSTFNIPPTIQTTDTLYWQFDSLIVGDSITITFDATVTDSIPVKHFPLINTAMLDAENDTLAENNVTSTTVYAIEKQQQEHGPTDLSLQFKSETDTTIIVYQNPVNAVMPGDRFSYRITVNNLGLNPADTVRIIHSLPDSVDFITSNFEPRIIKNDSISWEFMNLQPQEKIDIQVDVILADDVPRELIELISDAQIFSSDDTTSTNNFAIDTVRVLFKEPGHLKNYDLALSQIALTDTTIEFQGSTVAAVLQGDVYHYSLSFANRGPVTAHDISLWDIIPDSVTVSSFSIFPARQTADSLFWNFDSLTVGDTARVNFEVTVSETLPFTPFPLVSRSGVIAENDTLLENNFARSTVYAIQKMHEIAGATDVALIFNSVTDSTVIDNNTLYNAVKPGDDFSYLIQVKNLGPNLADTVKLVHTLPDSVKYLDATIPPLSSVKDSLSWEFNNFQPGSEINISISVQFAETVPNAFNELISSAVVSAPNDTFPDNNFATDIIKVLTSELPAARKYNLAISQQVFADTSIIIAGKPVPAVLLGDNYRYKLVVKNFGPGLAQNFILWDMIPDSILISDFNIPPFRQTNDSLFWRIDSLTVNESISIEFDARIFDELPFTPFPLFNQSGLVADLDTLSEDNTSSSLIYAIARPRPIEPKLRNADIALHQWVLTDSFAVAANDTLWYARKGETYSYNIIVSNVSQLAAESVRVVSILPDSITAHNFDPLPEIVADDSVRWFLGVLLPQTSVELHYDATVAPAMPIGKNLLIHQSNATASNEDPTRLFNNNATSTVINLVKPAGDWQPFIEATPPVVKVGNSISVRIKVTVPIESWDLWVYLANGQIETNYGNDFIASNLLVPDVWTEIDPQYTDTKMVSNNEKEPITFELRVVDVFGEFKSAQAEVTLERDDDFDVDRNVFVPDRENELPIKFKLSANHQVCLELFDITGTRITKIVEGQFQVGWNTFSWDGLTENGQKIGSGFYILTIRSGEYQAWKKLMIVR